MTHYFVHKTLNMVSLGFPQSFQAKAVCLFDTGVSFCLPASGSQWELLRWSPFYRTLVSWVLRHPARTCGSRNSVDYRRLLEPEENADTGRMMGKHPLPCVKNSKFKQIVQTDICAQRDSRSTLLWLCEDAKQPFIPGLQLTTKQHPVKSRSLTSTFIISVPSRNKGHFLLQVTRQ